MKTPIKVEYSPEFQFIYLVDCTGRKIGTMYGTSNERADNAEIIVAAVNAITPAEEQADV